MNDCHSQLPAGDDRVPTPNRRHRGVWVLGTGDWEFLVALALCAAVTGCGKKGPPLAPIVRVPAAVDKLSAQRVGDAVYLTVTIPTQNIDASSPADVSRIEIFGATTSAPPPRARFFEVASRVATIDVQPAARPGEATPTPAPGAPPPSLPAQGASVTIRDELTPAELVPKELPAAPASSTTPAPTANTPSPFPRRYYLAVATSDRGRTGPPGTLVDLPLTPLPEPPGGVSSTHDQDTVTLSWEPAGGVVGFLLENPAPLEPPPVDEALDTPQSPPPVPAGGAAMYNVYREDPAATAAPGPIGGSVSVTPPSPLNPAPISALSYTDSTPLEFGRPRCYTVRTVRGSPPNGVLSAPSERHCVTPEDRFAPVAPTGLTSIGSEGVIALVWEPNGEADLDGYMVLRGRVGDATLQPITQVPVKDVRYEDRDVMPGVRYVYAVTAVDTRRNSSEESNRVEETAR